MKGPYLLPSSDAGASVAGRPLHEDEGIFSHPVATKGLLNGFWIVVLCQTPWSIATLYMSDVITNAASGKVLSVLCCKVSLY